MLLMLIGPAVLLSATTAIAVTVGDITHTYLIKECLVLDPKAGEEFTHEMELNGEIEHSQFVTNICEKTITVEIVINHPDADYIDVTDINDGSHTIATGITHIAKAKVFIANNAPVGESPPLTFQVTRPDTR